MMPAVPDQSVSFSTALLLIGIDSPAALALRRMVLVQDKQPKYLLVPEVIALLHYIPDRHRKMLQPPTGIPAVRQPAVRLTGWFCFLIRAMSVSRR